LIKSGKYYSSNINLIQGNIIVLPFKNNTFDFIHCAGVLHHNPSTYNAFLHVAGKVKNEGIYFIEVYSMDHKNLFEKILVPPTDLVRKLTTILPHSFLHFLCYILSPAFWIYIESYNLISGTRRYTRRNLKTIELSLFDSLSPRYDWRHSTKTVVGWFSNNGFVNIKKTFWNQNGIGVRGKLNDR